LRPDEELQAYLYQVLDMLENRIHGPYQVFHLIFGIEAADRMANLGECIGQPQVMERPYPWLTNADSCLERSISSGSSMVEDDEERENAEGIIKSLDPEAGDAEAITRSPEVDNREEEDDVLRLNGFGEETRCAMFE
jgi:hypothetical protein